MAEIFGIGNKKGSGGSVSGRGPGAINSETDSETLKALEEVNIRLKDRKIKAKLVSARNSLFIRGTYKDSSGFKKERKIPTRLSADINNLVSAEARILQLYEYVNKNGFIPDQLLWDTPKVEVKGTTKGNDKDRRGAARQQKPQRQKKNRKNQSCSRWI